MKEYTKAKRKTAETQSSKAPASSDKNKGKGKSKEKDVDFDEVEQDGQEGDSHHAEGVDEQEDPEVYFADAKTSDSEMGSGVMPDWSASECTGYRKGASATVACASPQDSKEPLCDTWEWRGPCCLVRVHRQVRRCGVSTHRDYLFAKLQEVHQVMEEMKVTQEEMKVKPL